MEDRFEDTKKAGIFGILGNVFLLFIKSGIGLITGSQSMIADSANSASDIFSSLMTFIGNKIASTPGDESHNFGHGKAEYIFSFLISISMILLALKLLLDSALSLFNHHTFTFSWILVIVCIATIITKLTLYLYVHKLNKKHQNILLEANMKDHRNDCIVTTFTLISIIFSLIDIYWIDGIVGMAISVWICYTGIKIFIESYNVLMDISLDSETRNLILSLTEKYKDIQKVKHFYTIPVGYQHVVVLTIYVDGNMTTFKSHELADNLENEIKNIDKIYRAIIHVNPI